MTGSVILQAKGLNKNFGAVVAAADINVDVPTGQRLSLIGANGAGKTTFVNMVTGYLAPDTGDILLADQPITRMTPRRITQMGVCRSFQIPQLCEAMTPRENLLVAVGASGPRFSFFRDGGALGASEQAS